MHWGPQNADSPRGSPSRTSPCLQLRAPAPAPAPEKLDCLPPVRDPPRPQEGSDRIVGGCGKTGDWSYKATADSKVKTHMDGLAGWQQQTVKCWFPTGPW